MAHLTMYFTPGVGIRRRPCAWNQHVLIGRSRAVPSVCGNPSEGLCTLLPARISIGEAVGSDERDKKAMQSNAAAVSHGHLDLSNDIPVIFRKSQ